MVLLGVVTCTFGIADAPVSALPFHTVSRPAPAFPVYGDVGWSADGGIPVELGDGAVLYLFGDTVTASTFTHNSAVIVSYGATVSLWSGRSLLPDGADSWFWPADAIAHDDGSLTVVANEIRRDTSSVFGFESFDTDMFIVRDPYSAMSWQLAEHVDAGPWNGLNVSFLDAERAVVRPFGSDTTYLADLTTPTWERTPIFDGRSDGTFVPVEHDGAWWGLTWDMASGDVALHRADTTGLLDGVWVAVGGWQAEPNGYGHQLHVVDGRVVYVHSVPGEGYELGQSTAFPLFEDVTDRLA